ncbi:hypothetical protein OIO90_001563 [Microbotryomycetes sp. JL221]|nr:hypothetical protein OIO90_001563 [Microbotryomycetes sp. JL221]
MSSTTAQAQDVLAPPVQDSISLQQATTSTSAVPSLTSNRPDAHTQRYDRQLRLWASSGQNALEQAHVLVINGSATASSTLKNLVLPGIGQFTIIDSTKVKGSDIGNNFFLETSSLGKSRAQETTRLLLELNETVKGHALVKDLSELVANPQDVLEYTLIIAVDADPENLVKISDIAWDNSIPLIKVQSCGFYGSLRTQVNEFPIVETHPESLIDLRIHAPFPELVEYANSIDYSTLDNADFSHVPAIIVLVKAMEQWKLDHSGQTPQNMTERREFISQLTALKRKSDDENIDEAVALYRRAGTRPSIPTEIQELFDDPACRNLTKESSNFWLLLRAVYEFTRHPSTGSLLPLSGALPDMHADSKRYVQVQNLYKTKARQDVLLVENILKELIHSIPHFESKQLEERISKQELETFVKHCSFLKLIRGRSLRQELESPLIRDKFNELKQQASLGETVDDSLSVWIGLRAMDKFMIENARYPGTSQDDIDGKKDIGQMLKLAGDILNNLNGGQIDQELTNVVEEICRAGASDLPQMAALLGGMVAQEAIKLITKQYVPLNGTCIFNGIRSTTSIIQA